MPFFSVVMPTYNSERTIALALESLRSQQLDENDIELLVIDGGSSDKTREIAIQYGAIVLNNPRRLPEYAKAIGISHASGNFVIKLDSDEELTDTLQLKRRKDYLINNSEVKAILADRLLTVPGYGVASSYLNMFGDPFTLFCYQGKGAVRETFSSAVDNSSDMSALLAFKDGDIRPIGDSGSTTISLDYIRERFPERLAETSFACSCFDEVVAETRCCACLPGDDIKHHSGASFTQYIRKLRFRVINNLFHREESGFSQREGSNPTLARRKYLFVLYSLSIICPLIHSVYLALRFKDATLLLHFVYVYCVCFLIAWYLVKSIFGGKAVNTSYGS